MDIYRIKKYCFFSEKLFYANKAAVLKDSAEFFGALFDLLYNAKESIVLEFYEFADDEIGQKIAGILMNKAKKGVKVVLTYDSVGSLLTSRNFFEKLKKSGVKVHEYNPARRFYSLHKLWRRNHRKMVVVDSFAAIVGGFNISMDYVSHSAGGRNWKDLALLFHGDAVKKLYELNSQTVFFNPPNYPKDFKTPLLILSGSGLRNFFSIRRNYKHAIDRAQERIYITNAYFLPDRFIYRRLIKAVRRGVDVRIITPKKTDHPYVRLASRAMFTKMIKNGIKIYEWQKEVLHSKCAVIDDFWVSAGSHNLDHRSLHYNLELNVNVYDELVGTEMRDVFLNDLKNCAEITLEDCKRRPLSLKILSAFLYLFRSWL